MTTWKDFVAACESRGIDPTDQEAQLVRDSMPLRLRAIWEDDGSDHPVSAMRDVYAWMIEQVTT